MIKVDYISFLKKGLFIAVHVAAVGFIETNGMAAVAPAISIEIHETPAKNSVMDILISHDGIVPSSTISEGHTAAVEIINTTAAVQLENVIPPPVVNLTPPTPEKCQETLAGTSSLYPPAPHSPNTRSRSHSKTRSPTPSPN